MLPRRWLVRPAVRARLVTLAPMVLFVLLQLGCGQGYRPASPRTTGGEGLLLALDAMLPGSGVDHLDIRVRVQAAPPATTYHRAALADAREPRCQSGVASIAASITGARWVSARTPLRAGDTLEVRFPVAAWELARSVPSRLDLLFEDEIGALKCATIPLTDAAPEYRWNADAKWSVALGLGGESYVSQLGEIEDAVVFAMTVGRWFGPLRLSLGFTPGVAQCPRTACPAAKDEINNAPFLPLTLAVDAGHSFAALRLGLGVGYRGAWARVDERTGSYSVLLHGPVLAPRVGFALPDPLAPGVPGGERAGGFVGVEVPVSYNWTNRGDSALGIGGTLVFGGSL